MIFWPLVLLLLASLLTGEVGIWLLREHFSEVEVPYRLYHLGQMLVLLAAGLLLRPTVPRQGPWAASYWLILFGLLFSFCGDLINSFLFDLSHIVKPQTLLSVGPFALAHCLYISAFWRIGRAGSMGVGGVGIVLTLLAWPVLSISLWMVLVDYEAGPLLKWLSLGYAHMVVLMALFSLWPLKSIGLTAWVAAAGGLIFLTSDGFFGAWLTEGRDRPLWASQVIWSTYFLGQLCILHVPLIGKRRSVFQ